MPTQFDFDHWLNLNGPGDNSRQDWHKTHRFLHAFTHTGNSMYLRMVASLISDFFVSFQNYPYSVELLIEIHKHPSDHEFSSDLKWMESIVDDGNLHPDFPHFENSDKLMIFIQSLDWKY